MVSSSHIVAAAAQGEESSPSPSQRRQFSWIFQLESFPQGRVHKLLRCGCFSTGLSPSSNPAPAQASPLVCRSLPQTSSTGLPWLSQPSFNPALERVSSTSCRCISAFPLTSTGCRWISPFPLTSMGCRDTAASPWCTSSSREISPLEPGTPPAPPSHWPSCLHSCSSHIVLIFTSLNAIIDAHCLFYFPLQVCYHGGSTTLTDCPSLCKWWLQSLEHGEIFQQFLTGTTTVAPYPATKIWSCKPNRGAT